MKILYPRILDKIKCIGVTAPSSGLGTEYMETRFDLVANQHRKNGIEVIEGNCLRENHFAVSGTIAERLEDFWKLWEDEKINLIQPPWGGEILIELLEHLDFEKMKDNPKWVQGYSDISTLLFAITMKAGIATAHGTNFMDSIQGQDELTANSRNYMFEKGEWPQRSSEKWQKKFVDFAKVPDTTFALTEITEWKVLNGNECEIEGRVIGGCFDTLKEMIGTPYGNLPEFNKLYANGEGLLLYLENCEQKPYDFYRALMSMKYAGWFDNVNGVVFGRNCGPDNSEFSYLEALKRAFVDSKFPIVWDADIGHKPPQMTMINGSVGKLIVKNGKAELIQKFI